MLIIILPIFVMGPEVMKVDLIITIHFYFVIIVINWKIGNFY